MFVRWKRRESSYKHRGWIFRNIALERGATISAVLVESVRVDGKPRQRFICHLAKVREKQLDEKFTPFHFWRNATNKLASLPLDDSEKKKIEDQLSAKIPRPSDAEAAEFWQGRDEFLRTFTNAWKALHPPKKVRHVVP